MSNIVLIDIAWISCRISYNRRKIRENFPPEKSKIGGFRSDTTYNAAAAQQAQAAAQAQTNQDFERIEQNTKSALNELDRTILRKQTVFPNQWYGGYIELERIPMSESGNILEITVDIGGEKYLFSFSLYKVNR